MSTVSHYDQGDLALFAMQLLPRQEHRTMALHIADCSYCRQELAQLQGDLAAYNHAVDMHSPPSQVRERLLHQIAREKKFVPAEKTEPVRNEIPARPERTEQLDSRERVEQPERSAPPPSLEYSTRGQSYTSSLGNGRYLDEDADGPETAVPNLSKVFMRVFPWLGWAAAAGLAVTVGNLYHDRETQRARLATQASTIDRLKADAAGARQLLDTITDPSARQVTLTRTAKEVVPSIPQGRVIYVASRGALVFLASNLEPVETYKTYELWLIPADGRDPIPSGTFHPDSRGNASVILPPLPKGIEARTFGITVEDDGGSQTPTMPIVMAGS